MSLAKRKIFCCLFLAFVLFTSGCDAVAPGQDEYITLGALLPLTGMDAAEGLRALNGLQLAKEEINENGGILGKQIDVIVLNNRGDREYIIEQYQKLKERGVSAIIGSSHSHETLALAKAAEKDGLPVITPTATDPAITQGRRNVFRAIFVDDYQAEVLAHFAYHSLGSRTAVVLTSGLGDSRMQMAGFFAESFQNYGGTIMAVESIAYEEEIADILSKYTARPPDIIFYPDYFIVTELLEAAYGAGLANVNILGSDAWDGLLANTYLRPEITKNVYYSSSFSFNDPEPIIADFVVNYFLTFCQMPMSETAAAYTCMYLLAQAIEKAGNTDSAAIVNALREIDVETILGRIQFDGNNNPRTSVYIIRMDDGVYTMYNRSSL